MYARLFESRDDCEKPEIIVNFSQEMRIWPDLWLGHDGQELSTLHIIRDKSKYYFNSRRWAIGVLKKHYHIEKIECAAQIGMPQLAWKVKRKNAPV